MQFLFYFTESLAFHFHGFPVLIRNQWCTDTHSPFEILSEFSKSHFSDLDIHVVSVFLEKVPSQFMGKQALLSDGRTARIQYLNPNDFEYPIVSVDRRLVKTNKYLKCVAVDSFSLDDLD